MAENYIDYGDCDVGYDCIDVDDFYGGCAVVMMLFELALTGVTLCQICRQWKRRGTVPAMLEWLLLACVGYTAACCLAGIFAIPAWALAVGGTLGVIKAVRDEDRRMALETARLKEEHCLLMMRMAAQFQEMRELIELVEKCEDSTCQQQRVQGEQG